METAALHGKSTEFLHLQKAILPATFGFGPSTHFFLKNSVVEFQRLSSEFWTQWAWELSHLKSILKVNMWLACVELFGLGLNETRLEDLKCCQGVHDAIRCMMPIRKSTQSIKQKDTDQVIYFIGFKFQISPPPSNVQSFVCYGWCSWAWATKDWTSHGAPGPSACMWLLWVGWCSWPMGHEDWTTHEGHATPAAGWLAWLPPSYVVIRLW